MTFRVVSDPVARLRERAATLGVPAFRLGPDGTVTEDASQTGVFGIWLRSPFLANMLKAAAQEWQHDSSPRAKSLFAGCWALPVPIAKRGERAGYFVALAIGPDALRDEAFTAICSGAQLDAAATRGAMRPLANFDEPNARRIAAMLGWMLEDSVSICGNEHALEGFAGELSSAYESMDLLYTLGRAMGSPTEPDAFLELMLDQLDAAMEFSWIAVRVEDSATDLFATGQSWRSTPASDALVTDLESAMDAILASASDHRGCSIVSDLEGAPETLGAQVLHSPVLHEGAVIAHLIAGDKRGDDPQVSSYDTQLFEAAGMHLTTFLDTAIHAREQQRMFLGTVRAMTSAIDAKDAYTRGHSERVAMLARMLAIKTGLSEAEADRVHISGLVHDVGKIGIPESVLCKSARLTDDEFDTIKTHPAIGHRILRDISLFEDILPGVMHHHERWDGNGYPEGLAGENIPLVARLIGLADTFDAMSSNRAYRPAMDRRRVLDEIARCAGTQFDPTLAKLFLTLDLVPFDRMIEQHQQQHAHPANAQAPTQPDQAAA